MYSATVCRCITTHCHLVPIIIRWNYQCAKKTKLQSCCSLVVCVCWHFFSIECAVCGVSSTYIHTTLHFQQTDWFRRAKTYSTWRSSPLSRTSQGTGINGGGGTFINFGIFKRPLPIDFFVFDALEHSFLVTPFPVYFDTPFIRVPKVPYSPAYRGMPLYTKQAHFPLVGFLVFIPRYIGMPNFTRVYRHLVKIS